MGLCSPHCSYGSCVDAATYSRGGVGGDRDRVWRQPVSARAAADYGTSCDGDGRRPDEVDCLGKLPAYFRWPPRRRCRDLVGRWSRVPILGMAKAPPAPEGVATLVDDERRGGNYLHKTLWAVSPEADGDLIVRGESLRSGAPLRFLVDRKVVDRLHLSEPAGRWRYFVTTTVLPAPGCYAFRIIGDRTNDRIVFKATLN